MGKDNQKYWLGPGVYGTGKKMLRPNDPIPADWPKENFKRFKHKIGEKIVKPDPGKRDQLRQELEKVKAERDQLKKELEEVKIELKKAVNNGST